MSRHTLADSHAQSHFELRNLRLTYLLVLFVQLAWAQDLKIGVINDPDGYTNIREGEGTSYKIVDRILDNEIFYYEDYPNDMWLPVYITKCSCDGGNEYSKEVDGYVHRSRILEFSKLGVAKMKERLNIIFDQEIKYLEKLSEVKDPYSKEHKVESNRWAVYHEMIFDQSLTEFSNYICEQKDSQVFEKFKKILILSFGSADELPSIALGRIFNCLPDWTLYKLGYSHDHFYSLEWGFVNSEQSKNAELRNKLNNFRVKIGLKKVDYDNY